VALCFSSSSSSGSCALPCSQEAPQNATGIAGRPFDSDAAGQGYSGGVIVVAATLSALVVCVLHLYLADSKDVEMADDDAR